MRSTLEQYFTDRDDLRSFYSLRRSTVRTDRLAQFDDKTLAGLTALDYGSLSVEERIDYHLLRTELEFQAAERELLRTQMAEAASELPFRTKVFELEQARWAVEELDPQAAAGVLEAIAKEAQETLDALKGSPDEDADADAEDDEAGEAEAPVDAPRAVRLAKWSVESRNTLRDWYRHYAKFMPEFAWWCKAPYDEAYENLTKLSKYQREELGGLKGEDDDPLVGTPIGREALKMHLAHEWLAYTPDELIEIGNRQLAWCENELRKAAAQLGHEGDWKAALEQVKGLHVAPGEQDSLVARQAREAIAWLKDNDLVTIPALCEETWRVKMIDEQVQRTLPFAAYGGQKMLVAYPTSAMEHESKLMSMRGNNIHFTRCVTPHELIPGHHLQGFMAQRYRTHRRPFRTPFLVEGWALYWEMVEFDGEWPRGPEDRIGMLFWRMHRAARIVVSLKYHLGEMQPDEMIDFLVERVGHERDNATSEVRRYVGPNYSPLYQCGYMIGGLQLRALGQELMDSGRMTAHEYHDAILRENSIPVELIRAALTSTELEREARASWKPALGER